MIPVELHGKTYPSLRKLSEDRNACFVSYEVLKERRHRGMDLEQAVLKNPEKKAKYEIPEVVSCNSMKEAHAQLGDEAKISLSTAYRRYKATGSLEKTFNYRYGKRVYWFENGWHSAWHIYCCLYVKGESCSFHTFNLRRKCLKWKSKPHEVLMYSKQRFKVLCVNHPDY